MRTGLAAIPRRCASRLEPIPLTAFLGARVRVPDEYHRALVLKTHDGDQLTIIFEAVKDHTVCYLRQELVLGHIGFMITVFRYVPFVGTRAIIDDFVYCVYVLLLA